MPDGMRLHASAVSYEGRGVLILGASGSGKSALALHLMAFGAHLIADDQTQLDRVDEVVRLSAPASIAGLIEARGTGLLRADAAPAPLHLVIDLDQSEANRLPDAHTASFLGKTFPCLHKVDTPTWPFAVLQYLKGGRKDPE
ncbi:MAG: HPr kinase/phosphatase C-terminal domain-containing protein [Pseudomonadota bacterium]